MKCIYCGCKDSKVIDSRYIEETNSIRRRRECLNPDCQKRFNTYETIETLPIMVVKNDSSRQSFNPLKIKQGIIKSCEKRPVSISQINEMVDDIEKQIQNSLKQEITSAEIGKMIMERLKKIDEVAYIRFASVYRKFTDVTHFVDFINNFDDIISKNKNDDNK